MTNEQLQAMNQLQEATIKSQWHTISRLNKAVEYWRGQALPQTKRQTFRERLFAEADRICCHWNEPTGLEGDEDSALQVERDVREFLGK